MMNRSVRHFRNSASVLLQRPSEMKMTTGAAAPRALQADVDGNLGLGKLENIEYRDPDGNLLNDEQVRALQNQPGVSFSTKYETRTRLVDDNGREVGLADGHIKDGDPVPHPDTEGRNPNTAGMEMAQKDIEKMVPDSPPTVDAVGDVGKERSLENDRKASGKPRPGSERDEATK